MLASFEHFHNRRVGLLMDKLIKYIFSPVVSIFNRVAFFFSCFLSIGSAIYDNFDNFNLFSQLLRLRYHELFILNTCFWENVSIISFMDFSCYLKWLCSVRFEFKQGFFVSTCI